MYQQLIIIPLVDQFFQYFDPLIPVLAPMIAPDLRTSGYLTKTNGIRVKSIQREATDVDVARREAWEKAREDARAIEDEQERKKALSAIGDPPPKADIGERITTSYQTGGKPIFWTGRVEPADDTELDVVRTTTEGDTTTTVKRYDGPVKCTGRFNVGFLLYELIGLDLEQMSDPMLETLRIPLRVFLPFLVLILVSFYTPKNSKEALDRYYAKMNTPVQDTPEADREAIQETYENPDPHSDRDLFPNHESLEIQKPRSSDVIGFVVCLFICFLLVGFAAVLAGIGA